VPSVVATPTPLVAPEFPVVTAVSTVLSSSGVISVTSNVIGTVYLVEESKPFFRISDLEPLSTWWWMGAPITKVGTNSISVDVQTKLNGVYRIFVVNSAGSISRPATQMLTISVADRAQPVRRPCTNQAANLMCLVLDTNLNNEISATNAIELPFDGLFDVTVNWGDAGAPERYTTGPVRHVYATEGDYEVTIAGLADSFGDGEWEGADLLTSVAAFGDLGLTSLEFAFSGAANLTNVPDTLPAAVTSTRGMFQGAAAFNQDISNWDVSNVSNMGQMFNIAWSFNQDISDWDVSSVTDMSLMFYEASAFNQPLALWDVSSVTNMVSMFEEASRFNRLLDSWDVSNVTNMHRMFHSAVDFNQDISDWDVSSVTDMSLMFFDADSFNQDISAWNVSNVTDMSLMFYHANSFNRPLALWDVSSVTNMVSMFEEASRFNRLLDSWNVSNVTNMCSMFDGTALSSPPSWYSCLVPT
jgi:surface protein